MNTHEAKGFLDDLFENVVPQGNIDRIPEFYTDDVVGHQNNQEFHMEEILERFKIHRKYYAGFSFKVESFVLINDLIVLVVRQQWLGRPDKEFYEAIVSIVYRLRQNKICEIWILADKPLDTYQIHNENFTIGWKLFKTSDKSKKNFLARLNMSEYLAQATTPTLSPMEIECLYYYLHGFTAKETAKVLNISNRTIESYLANLKEKLNCHTKNELRKKLFPRQLDENK